MITRRRAIGVNPQKQEVTDKPRCSRSIPMISDKASLPLNVPIFNANTAVLLTAPEEPKKRFPLLIDNRKAGDIKEFDPPTVKRQRTSLFRMQVSSLESARVENQQGKTEALSEDDPVYQQGIEIEEANPMLMDLEDNSLFERQLYSDGTEQQCAFCDLELNAIDVQEHMRAVHKDGAYDIPPRPGGTLLCPHPHCAVTVPDVQYLITHLSHYHNQNSFRLRKQIFPSHEAFQTWRDHFEAEHDSKLLECEEIYEDEHHNGVLKNTLLYCEYCSDWMQRGDLSRKIKLPCTGCPAHFNVNKDDNTGFVTVVGCFSHLGHRKKLTTLMVRKISGMPVKDGKFRCHECDLRFATKFAVTQHKKQEHETETVRGFKIQCADPNCRQMFDLMSNYVRHVKIEHGRDDMRIDNFDFNDIQEFEEWKSNLEAETCAAFVRTSGKLKSKTHRVGNAEDASFHRYMACHRSGKKDCRAVSRPGTIRKRQSKKIGAYCTAFLNVFVSQPDGMVKVRGCLSHFGHEQKPNELPLPNSLKNEIITMLLAGNDPQRILETFQKRCKENDRGAFLKRYEITNLAKKIVRDGTNGYVLVGDELMLEEIDDQERRHHMMIDDADQIISADDNELMALPKGFSRNALFRRKHHNDVEIMVAENEQTEFLQVTDEMIGAPIQHNNIHMIEQGNSSQVLLPDGDTDYVVINEGQHFDQIADESEALDTIIHMNNPIDNGLQFEAVNAQQNEYNQTAQNYEATTSRDYQGEGQFPGHEPEYVEQETGFQHGHYNESGQFVDGEFEAHPDQFEENIHYNEDTNVQFVPEEHYETQNNEGFPVQGNVYEERDPQEDGQYEVGYLEEQQYEQMEEPSNIGVDGEFVELSNDQYIDNGDHLVMQDGTVLVGALRRHKTRPKTVPLLRFPPQNYDESLHGMKTQLDAVTSQFRSAKTQRQADRLNQTINLITSQIAASVPQVMGGVRFIEEKEINQTYYADEEYVDHTQQDPTAYQGYHDAADLIDTHMAVSTIADLNDSDLTGYPNVL